MKSIIATLICILCFTAISNAQLSAGAGLLYGTETELGFNIRGEYDINDQISGVLSISRLKKISANLPILGKVSTTLSSIDLEGHYHFEFESYRPYVLAGLTNLRSSSSGVSSSTTGFNVGGGAHKPLMDNIDLFGETKYAILDGSNQLILILGGKYKF